jgi:hypothetical protein
MIFFVAEELLGGLRAVIEAMPHIIFTISISLPLLAKLAWVQ